MEHRRRAAVLGVLTLALAAVLHLVGPHGFGAAGHHGGSAPSEASVGLADHPEPSGQPPVEHVHTAGYEAAVDLVAHDEPTGHGQGAQVQAAGHEAHTDIHAECWIRTHDGAGDLEVPASQICTLDSFRGMAPDHLAVHPGRPPTSAITGPDLLAELGISRT